MKKLIAPISLALGFLGVLLGGFVVSAHAAAAADPGNGSIGELAQPIYEQIMAGHYIAAAAAALILSMALIKRYAPGKAGQFVHSDMGGSLTTLMLAMGGALFTATVGGATWHWGMLTSALLVGVVAMGGYTAIKRLVIEPLLKPLAARLPVWAQPVLQMVLWIFDKKFQVDPVKVAQVAGDAAVAAAPGKGLDAVVGTPTEL